jgi:hypothetical protein
MFATDPSTFVCVFLSIAQHRVAHNRNERPKYIVWPTALHATGPTRYMLCGARLSLSLYQAPLHCGAARIDPRTTLGTKYPPQSCPLSLSRRRGLASLRLVGAMPSYPSHLCDFVAVASLVRLQEPLSW